LAESPLMLAVVPETVTVVPVPWVNPTGPYSTSNVEPVDVYEKVAVLDVALPATK